MIFIPYEQKNEEHQNFVRVFYMDDDNLAYVPHLFKEGTVLISHNGNLVGAYSLMDAYDNNKILEYGLLAKYRENGIMYRALHEALENIECKNKIIASVSLGNSKSKNLLGKLGFSLDFSLSEAMLEEGMGEAYTLSKNYCNS